MRAGTEEHVAEQRDHAPFYQELQRQVREIVPRAARNVSRTLRASGPSFVNWKSSSKYSEKRVQFFGASDSSPMIVSMKRATRARAIRRGSSAAFAGRV
jgi:hypothetical protein